VGHNLYTFQDAYLRIAFLRGLAWTMNESFNPFKKLVTDGVEVIEDKPLGPGLRAGKAAQVKKPAMVFRADGRKKITKKTEPGSFSVFGHP
jgi:hypothetical protein